MFGGSLSVTVPWAESWQFPDDLHVCIEPSRTANAGTERRRAWAFCVIPAWAPRGSSGRQDSLSLGGVTGQGTSGEGRRERPSRRHHSLMHACVPRRSTRQPRTHGDKSKEPGPSPARCKSSECVVGTTHTCVQCQAFGSGYRNPRPVGSRHTV